MTSLLRKLIPQNLWLFGEIAAVTGCQKDISEARYMACILRENLESRAHQNNEVLVLASALMERPRGGRQPYAEILFDLKTTNDKILWFRRHIRSLLTLSLDPLVRHGVGFEFHAQNTVVRICRRTKAIKGFAIRDLAGVKLHGPTLEAQGFDLTSLEATVTHKVHEVWDRVHHALIQNHIGYLLYGLGLEGEHYGWRIVCSELERALDGGGESVQQSIYRYFVKETMPFKSFMRMRMDASLNSSFKIVEQQVPNVLWKKSPWLRQVSLAATKSADVPISPDQVDPKTRTMESEAIQEALGRNVAPYGQLPGAARRLNPHPAVLPMKFVENLERFHEALALALDDIINRWWTDEEADFPNRMPLEPRVETLLRWVARGSDEGFIRPYKGNQGDLRPDILIPASDISGIPQFKVCEVNGRFPISFLHYAASAYGALADTAWHNRSVRPATDHKRLFDSLFKLFDPSVPVHFVGQSSDFPQDSPLFGLVKQRTRMRPRSVKPSSLRLILSDITPTGFELYCIQDANANLVESPPDLMVDGQALEKVHQVGLQLYDFELFALAPEMIRQIAIRSVNDVRSVFIAHDKRILGIIHQELNVLVHKHNAITQAQARILRDGIIPTILPGSAELRQLAETASKDATSKDGFILKPFRLARGSGIVLGKNLSTSKWSSILESMKKVDFGSSETQYLLQPLLPLQSVDWFWDEERKKHSRSMKSLLGSTYIEFDDVEVPVENVLGEENKGFPIIMNKDAFNHALKKEIFDQKLIENQVIRAKFSAVGRRLDAGYAPD
ncbi:hypothetical protein QQX98_010051 [Neonectria punicea]|uniref:Aerobactin siderophore biosynthesis IucA/IucC-like C-terminal domain-containing protein n=1 Tax=Neonectria punicea TaxID=979145 RepID=A0ABR1GQW1_9HYPO